MSHRVPSGLRNTTAVVTGASSGIGRAIAVRLAAAGVTRLMIHYRGNRAGIDQTAAMLRTLGADVLITQADLAVDADVDALIGHAVDQLPCIDTWVNNAGLDVLTGDAVRWPYQQKLERLLRVDLVGTARLTRGVLDKLRDRSAATDDRPPSIVFIGWDQAPRGMEGDAGQMFGPVKAAVMAYADSLAQAVAPEIRVNTIAPGWIRTSWGDQTDAYWDRRAKDQSLAGRWGTPDDVAQAVAWVADPDHAFINAQTINVNGGWNRRYPVDTGRAGRAAD